jgi:putative transposase
MARFARVVVVGKAHHITQRGNNRRPVFETDTDRRVYLGLLQEQSERYGLTLLGYCLMTNHVHLIAVPRKPQAMSLTLRQTHGRYAWYHNVLRGASGHLWQGRYYSCPMDGSHVWAALRYTEQNPVRAGLVKHPEHYDWSSASAHCHGKDYTGLIDIASWQECWTRLEWKEYLEYQGQRGLEEAEELRRMTHTGRPLGSLEFVQQLEEQLDRKLALRKSGRKKKLTVAA